MGVDRRAGPSYFGSRGDRRKKVVKRDQDGVATLVRPDFWIAQYFKGYFFERLSKDSSAFIGL